jgi:hypothetical protein
MTYLRLRLSAEAKSKYAVRYRKIYLPLYLLFEKDIDRNLVNCGEVNCELGENRGAERIFDKVAMLDTMRTV